MRKFGVFTGTIFIAILLAGVFGVLHDQVTFSISPEYFTKFKYDQFGFDPATFGGHRLTVAVIGFLATWWMGMFIGIILASIGLIFPDHITMRRAITKAISTVFIITILFAVAGFFRGKYYLIKTGVDWWIPGTVVDRDHFIIVGSIHNYSYLGGVIGLLVAIIYLIRKKVSNNKATLSN